MLPDRGRVREVVVWAVAKDSIDGGVDGWMGWSGWSEFGVEADEYDGETERTKAAEIESVESVVNGGGSWSLLLLLLPM